jgi:tetratricopeptide (TPR) repeat protein
MTTLHGLWAGVLLVVVAEGGPAAPPEQGRNLTAVEQQELDRLQGLLNRHVGAGRFEEAARVEQQMVSYRAERQGAGHWQVIDARLEGERWQWLSKVPAKDRAEVVRAMRVAVEGSQLKGRLLYREAEAKLRQALAIRQKALGEEHPETAISYNNVAVCLDDQGRHAEALPLYQKALALRQKVLGEEHPETAISYNNVAVCLNDQGKHAEALHLHQKALALCQKVLGVQHPDTAQSYNGVAFCLNAQGKHAEALPLNQKALAIRLRALGEQHPDTAQSYNNLAGCLNDQDRHAEALPLHQKALAIWQKVLGEQHPNTATSYNNVALCLDDQGKHAEALPLHQKALAICQKVLGEQHPLTATSYNSVAFCLNGQGRHAEALPLFQKALAITRKVLGEQHPDTATSYNNVAFCLNAQGRHAEAARHWEKALLGHEYGRLRASPSGFDRSLFRAQYVSPRAALATCLVRLKEPVRAWEQAESDLARGLLDDLLPSAEGAAETDKLARISRLEQALLRLLSRETLNAEQSQQRDALTRERDALLTELARHAAQRALNRVLPLERIRKQVPADAALIFWLDARNQHLGCVLRHEGPPAWVSLPGSGKDGGWTKDDNSLDERVLAILGDGSNDFPSRQKLLAQLRAQRLAPLEKHLAGVRHLLVVPAGWMSAVPIEALTDRYTVSYVPSASVFARQMEQHRSLAGSSLLVLADPVFTRPTSTPPAAPKQGVLIVAVTPGSLAARIGLRPGDVLLEYAGKPLARPDDLTTTQAEERVPIKLWREGKTLAGRIPAGKLGVALDRRPLAEALAAWRQQENRQLALVRGDKDWPPLPGTRLEARSLAALVPHHTLLLGSDASAKRLAGLAASGKLKEYRLLHLATHGQANAEQPRHSALILSQDRLPSVEEAARAVLAGQTPPNGQLTVGVILRDWQLDADLVVLSACQTGLGKFTAGEGMLGFTQALMQKGARSVVLSRWKVDDAATALLMARFYQNLLGKREGLKQGLPRAEALREAKTWLRQLSRTEAEQRLAALVDGVPRGERGNLKKALPTRQPDAPTGEDRPFAHPYYWTAFVLLGDPN